MVLVQTPLKSPARVTIARRTDTFTLTVVSIRLTPVLASAIGWRWSFLMLVPAPLVGVVAIVVRRRLPEAHKIAHGLR